MIATYIPFVVALLLTYACVTDMRDGRIQNWISLALIALFAVVAVIYGDVAAALWQIAWAIAVLCLGLALYAFVGFGAGAVKLLAAAALFLPLRPGALLGILLLTMFLLGLVVTLVRASLGTEKSRWKMLRERTMPLSLPVAATCLLGMFWLQA